MYSITDLNNVQPSILDQQGYERLGALDVWTSGQAVNLIASFDSQCSDILNKKEWADTHRGVYRGYIEQVCNLFQSGKLAWYRDVICEETYDSIQPLISYDPDHNYFCVTSPNSIFLRRTDLLACLETETDLDIVRLNRYLHGQDYFESGQEKAVSARWSMYREPMEAEVKKYVNHLLAEGCVCDHAQVVSYTWTKFRKDDEIVKLYTKAVKTEFKREGRTDYHHYLNRNNVNALVREIYEDRAPDRIFKVTLHKRCKDCTVPHLEI